MVEPVEEPHPGIDEKTRSVEDAVDAARRNYGTSIDIDALVEALESSGWRHG